VASQRRLPRRPFVAIDCGSARLRVWWPGLADIRDSAAPPHHADGLLRGLVLDPHLVAGELRDSIVGIRPESAVLSVPVHAGHSDIAAARAAVAEGLDVCDVMPVPAAVAAAAATLDQRAGVVVDLGAALVEVSRVEAGRVIDRDVLGWGVGDLVDDLGRLLRETRAVDVSRDELLRALHGSLATGLDTGSGATREVRVERSDVEQAADDALVWIADRVAQLRHGPEPVVTVGGGARLPTLRVAALDWVGRLISPREPEHATVWGLAGLRPEAA
jgi:hypothetical protein